MWLQQIQWTHSRTVWTSAKNGAINVRWTFQQQVQVQIHTVCGNVMYIRDGWVADGNGIISSHLFGPPKKHVLPLSWLNQGLPVIWLPAASPFYNSWMPTCTAWCGGPCGSLGTLHSPFCDICRHIHILLGKVLISLLCSKQTAVILLLLYNSVHSPFCIPKLRVTVTRVTWYATEQLV